MVPAKYRWVPSYPHSWGVVYQSLLGLLGFNLPVWSDIHFVQVKAKAHIFLFFLTTPPPLMVASQSRSIIQLDDNSPAWISDKCPLGAHDPKIDVVVRLFQFSQVSHSNQTCTSIYLSVSICIYLYLSVSICIYLSIYLSISLSISLSLHLCIYLSNLT